MRVSRHGEKRTRERLGIPRKAVERMAQKALVEGRSHADFSGSFKRYLDSVFLEHQKAAKMRVYGQHLFIFASDETLITVWMLPEKFKNRKGLIE